MLGQQNPVVCGGYNTSNSQVPHQIDQFVKSQKPQISNAQVINL